MCNKVLNSFLLRCVTIFIFVLITLLQSISAYAGLNTNLSQENNKWVAGKIPKLLNFDDADENEINMDKAEKVLTNQLGLQRINEHRRKKGLNELRTETCKFGYEIVKEDKDKTTLNRNNMFFASPDEETSIDVLPSSVDNSQLPSFPPISEQGQLASCVAFATTYYQMTHMFGMALGWDAKNDPENKRKFSPKWTFNLTNTGENSVMGMDSTYTLFTKSGAALWDEFQYDGYDTSMKNITEWPTDAAVWRNALNYRIDDYGYIEIWDNTDTPVKAPNDPNLKKVKQLLNNGHVLTFATSISRWRFSRISDDPSTEDDNDYINQDIVHITDSPKLAVDGHVMTLVGYNDNIWVDINKNGIVDQGEKGAFKIANSWGTHEDMVSDDDSFVWYSNDGFIWLSYDTLNKESSVPQCPVTERKNSISFNNSVYWMSPKEVSTPKLLVEYTVNHANKYELVTLFGYSNYDENSPVSYFDPHNINYPSIVKASFDGTDAACDANLVFDISELYDRFDSVKGNLYISFYDYLEGNPCILRDAKIIDNVSGQTYYCNDTLPVSFDNSILTIGPIGFKKELTELKGIKLGTSIMPTQRSDPAVVTVQDSVYVIGGIHDEKYVNSVEVYDPEKDTWLKKNDLTGEQSKLTKAVCVNDKIYAIKRLSSDESIIEEYDSASDKWTYKRNINYWKTMYVGQIDGKIFIIGTNDKIEKGDATFCVEEYDPASNILTQETYLEKGLLPGSIGFMDGKIYIFNSSRYDPDIVRAFDTNPYIDDSTLRIYDTVSKSWEVGDKIKFYGSRGITILNGKFYGFWRDASKDGIRVCEYDPVNNTLKDLKALLSDIANFGVTTYKDNIITVGGGAANELYSYSFTDTEEEKAPKNLVQIININHEKTPPVLEPPADITLATTEQLTVVDIGWADAIGNSVVEVSNNAPEAFPLGTTNVLWSAKDEAGNMTQAIQKVTLVIDEDPPELIVPPDIIIGTHSDSKSVNLGDAIAKDVLKVSVSNNALQSFPLGETIVVWTAVDEVGNEVSKPQRVNVYKFGDANTDGKMNSLDFAQVRQLLLGYKTGILSEIGKYAADVDGNSKVNSLDFAIMRQYLLGKIDKFPADDE